jgi:L-fucose isomerase-like protein
LREHFQEAELAVVNELATTLADAAAVARQLKSAGIDMLVLQLATFTDASLIVAFFSELTVPTTLWALPEPSIGDGGRLRLNSLCGVNLAAYTLTSGGKDFNYVYGLPEDPAALETIQQRFQALQLDRNMRSLRLGLVGSRPAGFFPSGYDEVKLWREIGPQIKIYNLTEVFGASAEIPDNQVQDIRGMLRSCLSGLDEMPEQVVCTAASTYQALVDLAAKDGLGALAVKCWPEFFVEHQAAACGVLAALMENGLVAACEADVHGAVTMKALHYLSGSPAFLADLVATDKDKDSLVLWHCGNAAFSLAAVPSERKAGVHSNRKIGVTAQFALKPGAVTLARLSYSQAKYRLLLAEGEALDSPLLFAGNTAEVRPQAGAQKLLDTIIYGGFEHHLVMAYGYHAASMQAWADLIGLEVVRL